VDLLAALTRNALDTTENVELPEEEEGGANENVKQMKKDYVVVSSTGARLREVRAVRTIVRALLAFRRWRAFAARERARRECTPPPTQNNTHVLESDPVLPDVLL